MSFIDEVNKGRQGLNKGLPNGLVELNKYANGIQRGRYILIGAESGEI